MITEKDKEVLAYVTDVRAEDILDDDGDEVGFKIVFSFRENPFLTDSELVVTYRISEEGGYVQVSDIEGCEVHWRPEKDVTMKKMRKKPKPGAKNKQPQTKLEPVDSFFRWFSNVPEVPDGGMEGDEDEEDEDLEMLRDQVEEHMRIGEALREDIVPHAVKWFTGQALLEMEDEEDDDDDDDDDDDEFDDEEDDGEDEDDEDDSDEEGGPGGPKDTKEQPAECKQQ